jgi:hypothetical protein
MRKSSRAEKKRFIKKRGTKNSQLQHEGLIPPPTAKKNTMTKNRRQNADIDL